MSTLYTKENLVTSLRVLEISVKKFFKISNNLLFGLLSKYKKTTSMSDDAFSSLNPSFPRQINEILFFSSLCCSEN